jgi:hypothetical protein
MRLANEAVAPIVTKQVFLSEGFIVGCVIMLEHHYYSLQLIRLMIWLLWRAEKRRMPHAASRSEVSTDSWCG